MAVQTTVTIKTGEDEIRRLLGSVNEGVLRGLAAAVADASPVDTGTYVTSHRVEVGDDLAAIPALYSSHGKPRNQDRAQYQGIGKAKMDGQIGALPMDREAYVIGNESEHRAIVEHELLTAPGGPGYKVFSTAASAFNDIVKDVKARLNIR